MGAFDQSQLLLHYAILKGALCRMRITDQSQFAVSVRSREKHEFSLVLLAKLFSPILLFRHGEFITDVACLPFNGTYLFSDVFFSLLFLILHRSPACTR